MPPIQGREAKETHGPDVFSRRGKPLDPKDLKHSGEQEAQESRIKGKGSKSNLAGARVRAVKHGVKENVV